MADMVYWRALPWADEGVEDKLSRSVDSGLPGVAGRLTGVEVPLVGTLTHRGTEREKDPAWARRVKKRLVNGWFRYTRKMVVGEGTKARICRSKVGGWNEEWMMKDGGLWILRVHSNGIKYWETLIQALRVMQMPWSNWVEDDRVGDTKSPILFIVYDPHEISLWRLHEIKGERYLIGDRVRRTRKWLCAITTKRWPSATEWWADPKSTDYSSRSWA